jgi:hypothetical protein
MISDQRIKEIYDNYRDSPNLEEYEIAAIIERLLIAERMRTHLQLGLYRLEEDAWYKAEKELRAEGVIR